MVQINEVVLSEKFAMLLPRMDKRQRRLVLGADARAFGHGGIRLVARAAGVSADTVGALLRAEGFSLQGTSRTTEGARHPDRDGQFRYINSPGSARTGAAGR